MAGQLGERRQPQPSPRERQLSRTGSDWQQSALHLDNTCNGNTKDSVVCGIPRFFSERFVSTATISVSIYKYYRKNTLNAL